MSLIDQRFLRGMIAMPEWDYSMNHNIHAVMKDGKRMFCLLALLALPLAGLADGAEAAADGKAAASGEARPTSGPSIKLSGFGTLGLAHSDNDSAQYVRDLSQPDGLKSGWSGKTDSNLGLQANVRFNAENELVIQGVSRYRYDGTYNPELTWAFLRHDFSPDVSARVGRLGTEFYMLADSRLIGYSNLTVRPPPDYFGSLVISYFDGADASAATRMGSGLLRGKVFAGYLAETVPFAENLTWNLKGSATFGGFVEYLDGPWQVRLSHAQFRFQHEDPLNELAGFNIKGLVPELTVKDKWAYYDSLGVVYDKGPLQVQAMYGQINQQSELYEDSWQAYAIAGYRVGEVTPYVGYSRVKSHASRLSTPLPPPLNSFVSQLISATHSDQHTNFFGARWDFRPNMALKAQADIIHGTSDSVFPFRNATPDWNGRMTVYSVVLDFVF